MFCVFSVKLPEQPSSPLGSLKWTVAAPAVTVQSSLSHCCGKKWGKHPIRDAETWLGSCSSSLLSRRSRRVSVSRPETLPSWSLRSDPSSSYVKEGGWESGGRPTGCPQDVPSHSKWPHFNKRLHQLTKSALSQTWLLTAAIFTCPGEKFLSLFSKTNSETKPLTLSFFSVFSYHLDLIGLQVELRLKITAPCLLNCCSTWWETKAKKVKTSTLVVVNVLSFL